MNVEIGAEAALFPEKEYIAVAVQGVINREAKVRQKNQKWPLKKMHEKNMQEIFYWSEKQPFFKLFLPVFKETGS
jgi:hypothetical protein